MTRLSIFHRQHEELMGMIEYLLGELNMHKLQTVEEARNYRKKLSELSGKLKVHIQGEDMYLYPKLINDEEAELSKVAQSFMSEMGGLAETFQEYNEKYLRYTVIVEDTSTFVEETSEILGQIKGRIVRENAELYPLIG